VKVEWEGQKVEGKKKRWGNEDNEKEGRKEERGMRG